MTPTGWEVALIAVAFVAAGVYGVTWTSVRTARVHITLARFYAWAARGLNVLALRLAGSAYNRTRKAKKALGI
jgi:hypothetical protein